MLPDHLYHYYEASQGPFRNLSDLPLAEAERIMNELRQAGKTFASKRTIEYLRVRRQLEDMVRAAFISKGGKPDRPRPHYMTLGRCPWLLSWYVQGKELSIPMDTFRPETLSFTYGDIFPAMRFEDGRPYRQQVYTLSEIPELVTRFGLPQDWNADGHLGPERYIEVQVWSNIDCFVAR